MYAGSLTKQNNDRRINCPVGLVLAELVIVMMVDEIRVDDLAFPEQVAFALSQSAVKLDIARQNRERAGILANALNDNLELWISIISIVERPDCDLTDEVKENLIKLAKFVSDTTMINGPNIGDNSMDTLINIDLQIAEGLLEGAKA